jgi:hypothetical protein
MGSLTNNPGQIAAPNFQPFPNGLDLDRCMIQHEIGIFYADPAATFLQGQLVGKNANGIAPANPNGGVKVLGIAKWNKALTLYGVNVDEAIVLPGTTAVALKKSNVSNVRVAASANFGTAYTVTTDYTVNTTNGTVTRNGAGGIADGGTVYVTYTYQLAASDYDFQGRNFWNFTDDVTIQDGRITVITGWNLIFTTQYDSSRTYLLGDALYAGSATSPTGLFTNLNTSNELVGRVIQLPSATDPYMGVAFSGGAQQP